MFKKKSLRPQRSRKDLSCIRGKLLASNGRKGFPGVRVMVGLLWDPFLTFLLLCFACQGWPLQTLLPGSSTHLVCPGCGTDIVVGAWGEGDTRTFLPLFSLLWWHPWQQLHQLQGSSAQQVSPLIPTASGLLLLSLCPCSFTGWLVVSWWPWNFSILCNLFSTLNAFSVV